MTHRPIAIEYLCFEQAVGQQPVQYLPLEIAERRLQDAVQRLMAGDEVVVRFVVGRAVVPFFPHDRSVSAASQLRRRRDRVIVCQTMPTDSPTALDRDRHRSCVCLSTVLRRPPVPRVLNPPRAPTTAVRRNDETTNVPSTDRRGRDREDGRRDPCEPRVRRNAAAARPSRERRLPLIVGASPIRRAPRHLWL